ncbi:unnamed protein product [Calicophoron daubneyi]|uniref:Uncharacterized protein n=1 Tax=Calicophoron daubneyi TaxID=300641 RepID=A0AAV2TS12_CALDB
MDVRLSANFCIISFSAVLIIIITYLSQASTLDRRIFHRYRRSSKTPGDNVNCSLKDGKTVCASEESDDTFEPCRRFLMFQCAVVLVGVIAFGVVRERQKHWDEKLLQKVNRQIAAGV